MVGHFAPQNPYDDAPQPIGYRATISAPHMHAYALEKLVDQIKVAIAVVPYAASNTLLDQEMSNFSSCMS